ncbi:Mpo1-like protein [Rheinheimera sp.]|uniref:Mpo1-like protein n=1 Tax=Rheinheimera TaxID=67575 RepID=UPI0037C79227
MNKFSSFAQFYPYYLSEHRHPVCRALHYIGSALVIIVLLYALWTQQWRWLWLLPLIGYGFAWVGHFAFEHNRPATFKHPLYSLAADWVMLKDFLTGQLKHKLGAN